MQGFIEAFEYNHTQISFFDISGVRADQSFTRIMNIAREITRKALPIKCVEAVRRPASRCQVTAAGVSGVDVYPQHAGCRADADHILLED